MILALLSALALALPLRADSAAQSPAPGATNAPRILETRLYRIRQTVKLSDIPAGEHEVRLWVPVPADGAYQHVLDRRVIEAPAGWMLEHQPQSGAEMIVSGGRQSGSLQVVVETTLQRQSPAFDLGAAAGELQPALFAEELRQDAPLMSVDPQVLELSRRACSGETDAARKVVRLLDAVADAADHYSKDPSKPKCGRGAAQDCLANGGGCCTDLHSLFIAAARAAHIPARMQYGYRLKADKENGEYDPSYRCWVEFYLAGSGWVPTDLVFADAGTPAERRQAYGMLDARRVWLWEGRSLELVPRQQGGPIETMSCGWAEIDGVPVDVLPAKDGSPSKLSRTILFQDLTPKAGVAAK